VVFLLGLWFWAITHEPGSGEHDTACTFTFGILLGLGADFYFALEARRKLFGQFRVVVAEGPSRKRAAKPAPQPAQALAGAP
jgi:hypothetical protein